METTSKTFWQTACELKIGPVPAPVYLVLAVIVAAATIFGQLPADMVGGIAIMMVMGILLGDIGLKVPILKDIGGPAILSIFIPSAMVYYGLLNSDAIKAITAFTKGANFLYFYISCLVVGSILGMVRTVLVQGFLRMFVPLVVGTVVASILGCIAGMLCGEDLYHTYERQGRRSPARRQDDGRGPRPRLLLLLCGQGARPLDSDPCADSDDHPCRAHQGP